MYNLIGHSLQNTFLKKTYQLIQQAALNDICIPFHKKKNSSIKMSQKSYICGALPIHLTTTFFYLMTARVTKKCLYVLKQ